MTAKPRDIRRLALQALYQLDARASSPEDASAVKELLNLTADSGEDEHGPLRQVPSEKEQTAKEPKLFSASEVLKAFDLAYSAYQDRAPADAFMLELAPDWPAYRQAAVDRAILRLAHFEMTSGRAHPKIVVNEAVELAKEFSTEKSPAFVNGLLDKLLKKVLGDAADDAAASADAPATPTDTPA